MPPWTWSDDAATRQPASAAYALAIDAASGSDSGSWSAAQLAYSVVARALSTSSSICAQRCETAW